MSWASPEGPGWSTRWRIPESLHALMCRLSSTCEPQIPLPVTVRTHTCVAVEGASNQLGGRDDAVQTGSISTPPSIEWKSAFSPDHLQPMLLVLSLPTALPGSRKMRQKSLRTRSGRICGARPEAASKDTKMRIVFALVAWLSVRALPAFACRPRRVEPIMQRVEASLGCSRRLARAAMRKIIGLPRLRRRRAVEASWRRPRPAGVAGAGKLGASTTPTRCPGLCECGSRAAAHRESKGSPGILSARLRFHD